MIFFVLPIILTILVPSGGLIYLCGRLNCSMTYLIFMLYPAIGVFIIYCFFASIVRLFGGWGEWNPCGGFCSCRIASATLQFPFRRIVQSSTLRSTPQKLGGCLAVAGKLALSLPKGRRYRVSLVRRSFSEGGSIELCLNR